MATSSNKKQKRSVTLMRHIPWRPLGGLLGPAIRDASQSLVAIAFAIVASLATGLLLASVEGTLAENQGLLLLFPAAIGLRGNVFGPFASRLSTSMQAGTFSWTWTRDSVLGQNIAVVIGISFFASLLVGLVAKGVAELTLRDVEVMSLASFVTISVVSAALATVGLMVITLGLATASTRFGWDLDNVTAPVVTAAGDLVTLPALLVGVVVFDHTNWAWGIDTVGIILTLAITVKLLMSKRKIVKRVTRESLPVLLVAGLVSLFAGLVVEGFSGDLLVFSIFLVLLPGYLTVAGSLGGILANRLSTKFHLGLVEAKAIPSPEARNDISLTFLLAVPIFIFLAAIAALVALVFGQTSPNFFLFVAVVLSGGIVATVFVSIIAYYGTMLVVRFGFDPDNHGIPLVSASLDLIGSSTLIAALALWGVI